MIHIYGCCCKLIAHLGSWFKVNKILLFVMLFTFILKHTKLTVDDYESMRADIEARINVGEYDENFAKSLDLLSSETYVIAREKLMTGESKTEKGLLKKVRKSKKAAELQRAKDQARCAEILAADTKTAEALQLEEDEAATRITTLRLAADDVPSFASHVENDIMKLVEKVDVVWVRDSSKLTNARLEVYSNFLSEQGTIF